MEFVLLTEAQKLEYRDTFIKMIGDCDHEFVPPLSHRFSPSQTVFTPDACTKDGLPGYVDDMCRISNILCAFAMYVLPDGQMQSALYGVYKRGGVRKAG